jgi:hypothetical protein
MHADAALTPRARLKLGRLVVTIDEVTVADAARRFQCSYRGSGNCTRPASWSRPST